MRRRHAYRIAEICSHYNVHYYPIVSSARAFPRSGSAPITSSKDWLGAVVYEDPGSPAARRPLNVEDPLKPQPPYGRVAEVRKMMREECNLLDTPIVMAGGVWYLREWADWIDNPELGPIAFQYRTRPLLTRKARSRTRGRSA